MARAATLNLGEEDLIGFLVDASNNKQDAHQASFTVAYPNTVIYQGSNAGSPDSAKNCDPIDLDEKDDRKAVKCYLGNPFSGEASTRLRFKKDDSLRRQKETTFMLYLDTTSQQEEKLIQKYPKEYTLKIKVNPKIKIQARNVEREQIQFNMVPPEDRITTNSIGTKPYASLEDEIGPKVRNFTSKNSVKLND